MGITDHDLFAMEEQLAAISRGGRGSDDWMTAANADSAAALHDLVRESRLRNREGVIARFHEGEVVGHTAPAHQILRASYEFNDAVIAVANDSLPKPFPSVNDAAREKLGMLMRPVLIGSIQIDLVCPDPTTHEDGERPAETPDQTMMGELDELQTSTATALSRVLAVLRGSADMHDHEAFAARADAIGPVAWGKIAKLSARCVDGDFTIDFRSRTTTDWFSFSPAQASALRTFIRQRELSTINATYSGKWRTASSVRSVFDLDLDDGTRISGTVPKDLRARSIALIEHRVTAVIAETSADDDDTRIKRVLVDITEEGDLTPEGKQPDTAGGADR